MTSAAGYAAFRREFGGNRHGHTHRARRAQFLLCPSPLRDWLQPVGMRAILEPALPIVDPHHHLWDRPDWRYLLPDLLDDLNSGHNHQSPPQ